MEPRQSFSIVVDDREYAGAVLAALQRRECVQLRVERLPVGDYRIDDTLLFERKTLPDLAASIKDGRLFAQGLRLTEAPLRAALILEGRSRDLAGSRMRREAIQGALVTLTLFLGIPLLRSMDPEETASLMLFAARQGRAFASGAMPRKGRRPRGKARVQSRILQGLPGIGPERAKRLLDRFGTIEAVIAAPAEALVSVPGIGQGTAEAIRWAVQETAGLYDAALDCDPLWPI
jgi:DNA excision repair protein ERCC-4